MGNVIGRPCAALPRYRAGRIILGLPNVGKTRWAARPDNPFHDFEDWRPVSMGMRLYHSTPACCSNKCERLYYYLCCHPIVWYRSRCLGEDLVTSLMYNPNYPYPNAIWLSTRELYERNNEYRVLSGEYPVMMTEEEWEMLSEEWRRIAEANGITWFVLDLDTTDDDLEEILRKVPHEMTVCGCLQSV